jgi:hypothetical protein
MKSYDINLHGPPSAFSHSSRIGVWHGAASRGDLNIEVLTQTLAYSVFEIPAVPDFSSTRFADYAKLDKAQRIGRLGERMNQFLGVLHALGPLSAVSLRYYFQPQIEGGKIRLFLIGRSCGQNEEEAGQRVSGFREAVRRNFPNEYSFIDHGTLDENGEIFQKVLFLKDVKSVAELLKPEQVLTAWHKPEYSGFSFYYVPKFFEPMANDMVDFCRALMRESHGREAIVDICLVPAAEITETERIHLGELKNLCDRWGRGFEEEVGGGLFSEPSRYKFEADPHGQEAGKAYSELLQRYGNSQNRYFLYAVRALWWETEPPTAIIDSLASYCLSAANRPQPFSITEDHPAFERAVNAARFCSVSPAVCRNDIWELEESPDTIRRLHRIADIKEVSGFFRLPIAGRDGCPGFSTDEGLVSIKAAGKMVKPEKLESAIWLGNFSNNGQVMQAPAIVPLKELVKHSLIVGMPGSGKTTLCFSLLKQLWSDHRVPFLVLEPAKTEYRGLKELPEFREDLLIFTVGNENISPLRFNPFEIPEGILLSEHLSSLKTCFSGAFNLFEPLPMILERALLDIYSDKGWYESSVSGEEIGLESPTMQDLLTKALEIASESSYRGETMGNIRGALEQRLGSLTRGVKGRCFNTKRSIPFEILLQRPVILELDALNDDEKALMMMFILSLVRAKAKINQRDLEKELKHVVLIEEAHNVVGRGENQGSADRANPQEVAIRFFTRMLAEMRAWGEGIIVADQLPTAIASEAVKNTKVKIMHKLGSTDDRKFMGETMNLNEAQYEQVVSLPPGQSLYFSGDESRSRLIVEPNFKQDCEDAGFAIDPTPDDRQISAAMKSFRERDDIRGVFLPYRDCSNVCQICDSRVREEMERLADKKLLSLSQEIAEGRKIYKINEQAAGYSFVLEAVKDDKENKIKNGCAFIHFNEKIKPQLKKDGKEI